jgi:ankyrin repeat protein
MRVDMITKKFAVVALCAGLLLSAGVSGAQEIFEAVKGGDLAKVKAVVGSDPQALQAVNGYKQTPLIVALQSKKTEIAEYLIARGADVNAKDNARATPLSYAIAGGFDDLAKMLIDRNADIDTPAMWNLRPIAFALEFGRKGIAEMLLDKGAIIPVEPGQESYRLFFSACSNGFPRLVDRMLAKGLTIGDDQYTRGLPQMAAAGGSAAIVEKLIQLGFNMNRKNELGWTPLHTAAEKGHAQVVAILLSRGADVDDRTLSGKSAYNIAVSLGKKEVAELLKEKGADLSEQKFPLLKGPYLGQPEPGDTPQLFALDIVTTQYMLHGNVVFTPDGREAYWSGTYPAAGAEGLHYQILTMKQVEGIWRAPQLAPFCRIEYQDDCPYITPDGQRIFFLSRRPLKAGEALAERENIWSAKRKGDAWGEPEYLGEGINALSAHWQVSTDLNGDLYFGGQDPDGRTMGDIFVSRFDNGRFREPEKLDPTVSSAVHEHSPFIAPDGSYIIFSRASQQRIQLGIFISFRKKDGHWGEAVCLNKVIGCPTATQCTYVTPDGKYFFYISRGFDAWAAYWVKSGFIEKLRPND